MKGEHRYGIRMSLAPHVFTDSLKGMPEALAAVFPATTLQTCIVFSQAPVSRQATRFSNSDAESMIGGMCNSAHTYHFGRVYCRYEIMCFCSDEMGTLNS